MTEQNWKEKFYIGSLWETRGGQRAVVVYHLNDKIVTSLGRAHIYLNTKGLELEGPQSHYDLIRPWEEKRTGTVFLNVYEDGGCGAFRSLLDASNHARDMQKIHSIKRIAFKQITWTEGEGL